MRVRTLEHFSDALSEEIVWRKKELTAIKLMIEGGGVTSDRRTALLRGALALLYAHWEGFVKVASKLYLEFVHYRRLPYNQLSPNFIALGMRGLLNTAIATGKAKLHIDVVNFFMTKLDDTCSIPFREGVNTKSNLSSKVLRDITDTLGLDYTDFETKEFLLDELLLDKRNTIAHGEYLILTEDAYINLHDEVVAMIEQYRTLVENAAALKKYEAAA